VKPGLGAGESYREAPSMFRKEADFLISQPHPTCDLSRCPSREDFPLIETEHEAYLRRIKSESTHRAL